MLQVYTTTWWMMAYGSPTPKRLQGRSNWRHVVELNTGKLARKTMEELTQFKTASGLDATPCNVLWTPRYMIYALPLCEQGKKGKQWTGNRNLKRTQHLECKLEF